MSGPSWGTSLWGAWCRQVRTAPAVAAACCTAARAAAASAAGCTICQLSLAACLQAGPGVSKFKPGDRVMSPFTTCCGACFYCARGLTARCERGQLFGWVQGGAGLHGAQAQFIK